MRALLRSVWHEPRAPDPPQRVWRDWALVAVLVPLAVLEGVLRPDLPSRAVWVPVAVGLLITLLWRRTRPLLVVAIAFVTTGTITLLLGGEQSGLYTLAAMLLLPYALFRWGSGREVVIGATILLVNVGITTIPVDRLPDAIGGVTVLSSSIALGMAFRYRARARIRELDQARLLERERLARDLHDTVAHHVSAMAIRAQAGLATAAATPDAAVDALRLIETEAVSTLAEMRAIVRALRRTQPADQADRVPNPGIGDVKQLAGPSREGPSVDVEISGDVDDLPPAIGTAIYRLAQESVTNAFRHARDATRVEVRVTTDDTSVRLRVTDDGDVGHARATASSGYGIPGMIERADLLGGTCEAGPNPGRGWTVTAVLPRNGAAA
jgi:signal transduction histidine kinase